MKPQKKGSDANQVFHDFCICALSYVTCELYFFLFSRNLRKGLAVLRDSFEFPRDPGSPKLRMVMEPKYYAFRRWLYTPIIIWQGDWIPRA